MQQTNKHQTSKSEKLQPYRTFPMESQPRSFHAVKQSKASEEGLGDPPWQELEENPKRTRKRDLAKHVHTRAVHFLRFEI